MDGGSNLYLYDIQGESFDYYGNGQSGRGVQVGGDIIGRVVMTTLTRQGSSDESLSIAWRRLKQA